MRVLIVTSAFPKDIDDSQGIIIEKMVTNLSKKGVKASVLAPHYQKIPLVYTLNENKIYRLPYFFPFRLETLTLAPGIYYHLRNSIFGKIQLIMLTFLEILAIIIICKREKIDIIHSHWILPHGLPGVIAGNVLSIPHICSVHGTDITITKMYPVLRKIVKIIAQRSIFLSTNSKYTLSILESIFKEKNRIKLIPMGVDNIGEISHKSKNIITSNNGKKILFVGRLIQWKGVHILIRAMNKVLEKNPDTQLFIIGEGICLENLQKLVIQLHLEEHVFFLGRVTETDLWNWYKKVNLFVLPSYPVDNQTEGLGVVLLEAMASGLPVIGSNTGGIPDIIQDGINGILVPPGNTDALAEAIIKIFDNHLLAEEYAYAGIKTILERFSWDVIVDQFIELYQNCCDRKY